MLHRLNCILVAFLLLPSTVQADRLENNRSAKKKKGNISSSSFSERTIPVDAQMSLAMTSQSKAWINRSMSQRIRERHADMDVPVSYVVHGSGAIGNARAKHAGKAQDILLQREGDDKYKYGICCLKVEHLKKSGVYVEKVDKADAFFIQAWTDVDKNRELMKTCDLMVVCDAEEQSTCDCAEEFNKTVEYHEMRTESLRHVKRKVDGQMNHATSKIDRDITEEQDKLDKLRHEFETKMNASLLTINKLKDDRVQVAQPWQAEEKETKEQLVKAQKEESAVKESKNNYKTEKEDFMHKCGEVGDIGKLGCCCQLKKDYFVVLKPANKFVPPKCQKTGLYTENRGYFQTYWSCPIGGFKSTYSTFFRQCDKCSQAGHIHGQSA